MNSINNEINMCRLIFPNGEISYCHIWNEIDLNNSLKSS